MVKFKLEIKRQVTLLQGDTATGKSYLVQLISNALQERSGGKNVINLSTSFEKLVVVSSSDQAEVLINNTSKALIIMDEDVCLPITKDLGRMIKHTDNYYLLVCRKALASIPYSMYEIYRFEDT